jgi:Uma2 family endonuclease
MAHKSECLSHLIFFGENLLRCAVREFVTHYHLERNHQGIHNVLIAANNHEFSSDGVVKKQSLFGGILDCYFRDAA